MKNFYKESYVEELRMQHMSYENARQEMRDVTGTITNIKEELGTRATNRCYF